MEKISSASCGNCSKDVQQLVITLCPHSQMGANERYPIVILARLDA